MEEENQKRILDPFEWIEVNYQLNNATEKDKLFTGQELKNLYPYLFRFYEPRGEKT